ncbi:MAG: lipopolysaccharide export system protein LptC [Parvibaculaceae bacterium]|jgi:lipopolysaccharide export system protein LptC|nr:LPS export ABC transporter periplasmic protein LptC [Parvibaculaceae bacterium]
MSEPTDTNTAPASSPPSGTTSGANTGIQAAGTQAAGMQTNGSSSLADLPPGGRSGRYSSFVSIMKIALPISAVLLVFAVFVAGGLFEERDKLAITFNEVDQVTDDHRMVNPRINGTDTKGRPFEVTATSARQSENNSDRISLENIQADMMLDETGSWLSLSAQRGLLRVDLNSLLLYERVDAFTTWGYEVHGTEARVDLKTGDISSASPVYIQGPLGLLEANKMTSSNAEGIIRFTDGIKLTLYQTSRPASKSDTNTAPDTSNGVATPSLGKNR